MLVMVPESVFVLQELAKRIFPLSRSFLLINHFVESRSQFQNGLVNHAFSAALRALLLVCFSEQWVSWSIYISCAMVVCFLNIHIWQYVCVCVYTLFTFIAGNSQCWAMFLNHYRNVLSISVIVLHILSYCYPTLLSYPFLSYHVHQTDPYCWSKAVRFTL